MKIVIALGGNAILQKGEAGTEKEQKKNIEKSCRYISKLIEKKHKIIITHGNGPQVGNILIQQEQARREVEPMPLDVCGAMSQGQIGYWIEQFIRNLTKKEVVTIVTQTLVKKGDLAFKNPTKPVGPYYDEKKSENMAYELKKGYRRVVASPKPIKILEINSIKKLVETGVIVICTGGGGIPVIKNKKIEGIEAVIDKDRASQVLANELGVDVLMILTAVSNVYLNFHSPNQKALYKITINKAEEYLKDGHFAKGSMGPKIEACITFIKNGGNKAIITSLDKVLDAIAGEAGTIITR